MLENVFNKDLTTEITFKLSTSGSCGYKVILYIFVGNIINKFDSLFTLFTLNIFIKIRSFSSFTKQIKLIMIE